MNDARESAPATAAEHSKVCCVWLRKHPSILPVILCLIGIALTSGYSVWLLRAQALSASRLKEAVRAERKAKGDWILAKFRALKAEAQLEGLLASLPVHLQNVSESELPAHAARAAALAVSPTGESCIAAAWLAFRGYDLRLRQDKSRQYFHLACCHGLLSQTAEKERKERLLDASIGCLRKALAWGWNDVRRIRTEKALVNLHLRAEFTKLLNNAQRR